MWVLPALLCSQHCRSSHQQIRAGLAASATTAPRISAGYMCPKRIRSLVSIRTRGAPSPATRCCLLHGGQTAAALKQSAAAGCNSVSSPHAFQDAAFQLVLRSGLQVAEVIVEALSQRGAEQKVVEIVQGKKVPQLPTDKYFDI